MERVMLSSGGFLSDCAKRCSCPASNYRSDILRIELSSLAGGVIGTYLGYC